MEGHLLSHAPVIRPAALCDRYARRPSVSWLSRRVHTFAAGIGPGATPASGSSMSASSAASTVVVAGAALAGLSTAVARRRRGSARSGHRAKTARRLWGLHFDGLSNVQGDEEQVFVAPPLELPQLNEAELHELLQGRPVQKQERRGNTGSGYVAVEVDVPSSLILNCLESFEDYDHMIPVVRSSKVQSRSRDASGAMTARCEYRVSRFLLGIAAVHRVDRARRLVRFDLDPSVVGMVLREASGFWMVEPLPAGGPDGKTARSRVWLRVGLRAAGFVPSCLIDYAADRALRRSTGWVKPHMEQLWAQQQQEQQQKNRQPPKAARWDSVPAAQLARHLIPA
eukprot:CAMPEP_0203969240 /NCGR_PEP_ID=MMETSP0359-20131031/97358_1 /ASSEMBLY_ACC=CAM_ASM_000338 /TAXON_ID=268821 /ORGANISM="Scrippsiella Hangoei, Strain SHTV-5" /LENGTH=339 /DNA_ID=CAMNT_0050907177 /DNA_START=101 /DNA_END=1120 /DNA_ORIENTATION=+